LEQSFAKKPHFFLQHLASQQQQEVGQHFVSQQPQVGAGQHLLSQHGGGQQLSQHLLSQHGGGQHGFGQQGCSQGASQQGTYRGTFTQTVYSFCTGTVLQTVQATISVV
jgi:hypothetical protein